MKRTELATRLIPSLTDMALVEMYARAMRETALEEIGTQAHGEAQAVERMLKEALKARLEIVARPFGETWGGLYPPARGWEGI